MLQASSSVLINASPEQVFELLRRPEETASRMASVREFKVISRGVDSILTETVAAADGRDTTFILQLDFHPPGRVDFRQLKGELKGELRSLQGEDILEPGPDGVRVTETIRFDIGLPIFGDLLGRMGIQQKIQQQIEERLAVLKAMAEGHKPV
ncbi:MAG: type II toxin-antitoxin system RatA family toxin [Thermoleophilia bacterium]